MLIFVSPVFGNIDNLLNVIAIVESDCNDNAIGDNGKAIGRYQIHKDYWTDGCEFLKVNWKYPKDAKDPIKAKAVVCAYFQKYGKNRTIEQLARIHNGGPKGWKKKSTVKYWKKVERNLK